VGSSASYLPIISPLRSYATHNAYRLKVSLLNCTLAEESNTAKDGDVRMPTDKPGVLCLPVAVIVPERSSLQGFHCTSVQV
jgi:hypothetical protein